MDVGVGLPGGGREGSGWEINVACVGRVLRAACVGRGHLCVGLYLPVPFFFCVLRIFLFLSFFNKRRKLKNKIKNMQAHI